MAEPNSKKCKLVDTDRGRGKFQANWIKVFPGNVDVSKLGSSHAFCKMCSKDFKVVVSSIYDLEEHFRTKLRERNFEMKKGASVKSFFAQPKYHGIKINRYVRQKKPAAKEVIISTVYDNPATNDPAEPLHRRNNPYTLKYRDEVLFQKATCPQNDSENE